MVHRYQIYSFLIIILLSDKGGEYLYYATYEKRIGAALIDVIPAFIMIIFFYGATFAMAIGEGTIGGVLSIVGGLTAIAVTIFQIKYMMNGQTIGKKVLNLQVVDLESYEGLGFLKMFLKEAFGKTISAMVLYLGFIWIFIDEENQAWHDKIFNSNVVELEE